MLGNAYVIKSELNDAVDAIEKAHELSPGNLLVELHLALAHYLNGNKQKGDDLLQNLQEKAKKEYVPASYIATLLSYLGESDQAYEWFKKACSDRDFMLPFFLNWPLKHFDIPDEKRFHDLIEKMWAKP
jgi:cytochrome c-type biogenesis protein CcmH/NrfG